MLKKRIIPKILIQEKLLDEKKIITSVLSKSFSNYYLIGDPISQAKIFESQLADELLLIDLDRKITDKTRLNFIEKLSKEVFMPLTVGGGIKSSSCISKLLNVGADKICINSLLEINPTEVEIAVKRFGSQCIVASLDIFLEKKNIYLFNSLKKEKKKIILEEQLKKIENLGIGEILISDVKRDGTGDSFDKDLIRAIKNTQKVPLLISGGFGKASDFTEILKDYNFSGVVTGTYLNKKDQNLLQLRNHLLNAGLPVRNKL